MAEAGAVSPGPRPAVVLVSSAHEVAGAEIYLFALLDALAPRVGLELLASDRVPQELHRRAAEAGVVATPVGGLARRPSLGAVVRLARMLRARKPALVHVNLSDQGDGLVAIAAARLAGLPVTATLHIVLPERDRKLELLSRHALRRARTVIAVSEAVGSYVVAQGASCTVVSNGVAPPVPVAGARDELGLATSDFAVGGVGRLDAQKGWDVLCAAASRVRARAPEARFVVVGDGPDREALAAAGRDADVRFAGYHERAAGLMAAFDVLAVPSRYEGFGLPAAEAMAYGAPLVAADATALPEVVGDAGLLVDPDDVEGWASAIGGLLDAPRERAALAAAGRERARRYSWSANAAALAELYRGAR